MRDNVTVTLCHINKNKINKINNLINNNNNNNKLKIELMLQ